MAGSGYPSPFGSAANLNDCEKDTRRYMIGPAGVPIIVPPDDVPAQAIPRLVLGNPLEASRTAKPGGLPTGSIDPPYQAQALTNITPQGRGILAEASVARVKEQGVRVKLMAKGYVNPRHIAERSGIGKSDVVASDLRFIP